MKKLLAMVLALVMTLSLAVSANAAFEDAKDINETYAEAIDVLAGLKVFQGYDNGKTFKPQGDITRAEVAAIVYRIYTGDTADKQTGLYASYNKFSDMNGAGWAAGYIGYCANAEFVKGYPDGTFKPSGKVTGYEALAMILRAVGYDKNGEFSGSDWALHVAQVAQQNGLLKNVKDIDLNKAASRELVAELLFQTITKANMVTYTPAFGYVTDKVADLDQTTLGYKSFELQSVSGEISEVSYVDKTTEFTYTENKTEKTQEVLNVDAGFEALGYEGYVWAVPGAKAKTLTAVSSAYITGESLGSSTNGTSYADLTDKDDDAFIDTDANASAAKIYKNGVVSSNYKLADVKNDAKKVGVKIDFVDNDADGKTDVIVVTEYTVANVTGIAKDTTSTGSNAVEKNKYYFSDGIGGVKASALCCDDELALKDLVTAVKYNGAVYAKKAGFVSDTFSRINYKQVGGAAQSYVVGDETYLVSAKGSTDPQNLFTQEYLNEKVDLYTDPYGHIIYAELSVADVNYMYVLKNDHTVGTTGLTDAKVVFTDGTEKIVAIKKVDSDKVFNVNEIGNHIYSYTENTDGSYTLKTAHTDDLTNTSYKTETANWGTLGVDKSTKVIDLRDGKDNAIYTGYKEIPSLTDADICYRANSNGVITLAFLTDGENTEDLTADLIVYKTSYNYTTKDSDGDLYYYLDVLSDGKPVEDYKLTADQYADITKLGVGEYVYDEKGALDEYIAFNETWVNAKWSDGALKTLNDNKFYTVDDEIKYCVLDITKGELGDFERVVEGGLNNDGSVDVKAYLQYNEKKTAVTAIYVILGDLATTEAKVVGTNPAYTYAVEAGKVTKAVKVAETLKASDFVSEVKFNSYTAELKSGAGTKADPFKMVATGCIEEASQMSTLKVTAPLTNMTIVAGITKNFSDNLKTANGILDWTTPWNVAANNYNSFRVTNADGDVAYFEVTFSVLSHNATPTDKTPASVHVDGTSIKVSSTYSQETTLTEAQLLAQLTLPEGATASYADGKLTVTAECGHAVEYTVTFVEGAANA